MKFNIFRSGITACILSLIASLAMSCASSPLFEKEPSSKTFSQLAWIHPDSPDPFARAIWNVKMNTPLVKKYIEPDASDSSAFSSAAAIIVKGNCIIDGNEYPVIYDLTNTSRTDNNHYRIRFSIRNITNNSLYYDEFLWQPAEDRAGILLSFDDDYLYAWRQNFYMLDYFGAKVTYFIQGSFEPGVKATPGIQLSENIGIENFCTQALRRGHDLGFHTINHYDLTKVSIETLNSETIEAANDFLQAGIPFSSFAFPFGFSNPSIRETLAPVFTTTRGYGVNIRFYNTETIGRGYVISKAIDNIIYRDDYKYEYTILMTLLTAKFLGDYIVPLTSHDISDNADWGIKPGRLEFLLDTANNLKLNFYTYRNITVFY